MPVQVRLIEDEVCDHCDKQTARPLYCFSFIDVDNGKQQLWLHKDCLEELQEKLWRLEIQRAGARKQRDPERGY